MKILFLSCWVAVARAISAPVYFPLPPAVTLPGGTVVSGVIDQNSSTVRQFLGIPYARPPVGALRWEPPHVNRLPASVNATAFGRSCTQFRDASANLFTRDVFEFNIPNANATGEDCLTLSIWTPQRAERLPVIVFFYGGGWYSGGQEVPYQNPTQWVQRTKDLIVVVPKSVSLRQSA